MSKITTPKTLYYIKNNQIHQTNIYEKAICVGKGYYKIWRHLNQKTENDPYSYNFEILEEYCFFEEITAQLEVVKKINKEIAKLEEKTLKLKNNLKNHGYIIKK